MNRKRLQLQMDLLRRVKENHLPFDMHTWLGSPSSCGTAACAFGYAALDPDMQAQGLALRTWNDALSKPGEIIPTIEEFNARLKFNRHLRCTPTFEGKIDYEAAAAFYDIAYKAATYLFDPDEYLETHIVPGRVIERIVKVIDCDGDRPDDYD